MVYPVRSLRLFESRANNQQGQSAAKLSCEDHYLTGNLLAELDGDNANAVKCSYMWGADLSGSLQGAGGVGGLLTVAPSGNGTHFVVYDGNGNVSTLTDSSGAVSPRYEYDPFGQTIRASGTAADLNPFRFS